MTVQPAADARLEVRRIAPEQWRQVRAMRLAATSDPDAAIAFLESSDDVAARDDEFWQERAEDAALSETSAQFFVLSDGEPVGTASVLVRATGQKDHLGRYIDDRRADVVGVWVRPDSRGSGAIDLLLGAASEWVHGLGLRSIHLDVHRDNVRAQGAYRRAGFEPTGETVVSAIGEGLIMSRHLR